MVAGSGSGLLRSFDYELELNLHNRSMHVSHLNCHFLSLRAIRAHHVPSDAS